jgi:hypothetical protein
VSYDLRRETGNASWNAPHVQVDTANIYMGEIGTFESVRFIETPRTKVRANASDGAGAAGNIDVYDTVVQWLTRSCASIQSVGTGLVATASSVRHHYAASSQLRQSE